MGPGILPETTVGKHNPPCLLQMLTKALSCKKEAICEHGSRKRRRVLWAKAHLKWTVSKWKWLWQTKSKFDILVEITDAVSSGLKRRETFSVSSAFSSKASISDGMGVHKCIRYGQLACFGRHYEC